MPDEDSTLAAQSQQTSASQPGDDDFVIDFGDGGDMKEIENSEEKSDEIFEINTDKEKNKDSEDTNFNQNELFEESSENEDENVDLGDTFFDEEKKENNEENDDIFANMSLNDGNNINQVGNNLESSEENNELFSGSESSISDVDIEDNASLGNDAETENNQDELFGEVEKGNDKMETRQTEELPTDSQENKVEDNLNSSVETDGNGTFPEEDDDISSSENDTLLDNTEDNLSYDINNNIEENSDIVNENLEENSGDVLSLDIQEQNNEIEGQLNHDQEIENIKKENDDDKIDFSFDSSDSDESIQENAVEEITSNPDNSESILFENGHEEKNTIDEVNQTENNENFEFVSDYHDDYSNQDEIQSSIQDNEKLGELSQNSNVENMDNDLSGNDSITQNEGEESEKSTNLENYENPIQNEELIESNEGSMKYNQSIFQDESSEGKDKTDGEFLLNNEGNISGDEDIDSKTEETQELLGNVNSENINVQDGAQPDMMNLLGGQPVDFSYEENATTEQLKSDLEIDQDETSVNLQNSVSGNENNNSIESLAVEEKSEINALNAVENIVDSNPMQSLNENKNSENTVINNTESQNQSIEQNTEENKINEIPENQVNENVKNQAEAGSIKSTLSLDEILDSELQSNPQFADNSKAIPKNIQTKSSFFGGKKLTIFAGIGVFLLFCIVAALAFPSISSDRKAGDVVSTGTVVENPEEPIYGAEDPKEYIEPEESGQTPEQGSEKENEDDRVKKSHGSGPKTELINDEPTENIKPYVEVKPEEPEDPIEEKESKKISIEDIQSKISSFKSKGEGYKKVGENNSNEKVIKYAAYIVRLCEEYQLQIDNGEGIDAETFSSFETKVLGFISKIEKNLNGGDEVSTIYTKVDFGEDDEKKELREYLDKKEGTR